MKKSLLFLTILMISFVLTGCGSKDLSKYAGTYKGQYIKFVGDSDDDKNTSEEFSLILNEDGTGKHNRDSESFDVTWSIDGENFTMTDKFLTLTIDYTGTLKDGKLDIFNGDPSDIWTAEYVYEKQ